MANNEHIDTLISTLLAAGARHDQSNFFGNINRFTSNSEASKLLKKFDSDPLACGATACAAGWAVILSDRTHSVFDEINSILAATCMQPPGFIDPGALTSHLISRRAQDYLGITSEQARFIFFTTLHASAPEECAIAALKFLKDNPSITHAELCKAFEIDSFSVQSALWI